MLFRTSTGCGVADVRSRQNLHRPKNDPSVYQEHFLASVVAENRCIAALLCSCQAPCKLRR